MKREEKGIEGMMEFEINMGSENDAKKLLMQARISYDKEWKGGRQKTDAERTP